MTTSPQTPLLEVRNLTTVFELKRGLVRAVSGVDLTLDRGDILGVVGESGCGKSVTMLSILRLVSYPGKITTGKVIFEGRDILKMGSNRMRKLRGREISMVFQDPMTTLNPVFPIGEQIGESLRIHGLLNGGKPKLPWPFNRKIRQAEQARVLKVLDEVGIPTPQEASRRYPHEYSGGMQQRALIAIALSCDPKIILADEPTTALDVTVQAQILELLQHINQEFGTSIVLVTHDLGLAAEFSHEIAVMYAGRVVEKGITGLITEDPKHPYTRGLLACIPRIRGERVKLMPIPGTVPDLIDLPAGCAFQPRCSEAHDGCLGEDIPLVEIEAGRQVRCILYS